MGVVPLVSSFDLASDGPATIKAAVAAAPTIRVSRRVIADEKGGVMREPCEFPVGPEASGNSEIIDTEAAEKFYPSVVASYAGMMDVVTLARLYARPGLTFRQLTGHKKEAPRIEQVLSPALLSAMLNVKE
jgi:hypothetical protein